MVMLLRFSCPCVQNWCHSKAPKLGKKKRGEGGDISKNHRISKLDLLLCCENHYSLHHHLLVCLWKRSAGHFSVQKHGVGKSSQPEVLLLWQHSRIKQHLASRQVLLHQVGRFMSIWTTVEQSTHSQEDVQSSAPPLSLSSPSQQPLCGLCPAP